MDKRGELTSIKNDIESLLSGSDIVWVDDLVEELIDFIDKYDPDGDLSEDPLVEAAVTVCYNLEELSSALDGLNSALVSLNNALNKD